MVGGFDNYQEQSFFADYIYRIMDSIEEIQRRIFLKYTSNKKAEQLRVENEQQTLDFKEKKIIRMMNVLQKAQTEEAWFKEELLSMAKTNKNS